jgi:hypothetical protein
VAGTVIKAVFVVNNTGGPINLTDPQGCLPDYGVTLTSESFGSPCIGAPLTIKHGTNRFPTTVLNDLPAVSPTGR